MANITPRKNKDGIIISYLIRVHRGRDKYGKQLKPYTTTFKPDPTKSDKKNEKDLNRFVVDFENKCKMGLVSDSRQTLAEYIDYVLGLKDRNGLKRTTLERYRNMTKRIIEHLGELKLTDIRPQHLNKFYEILLKSGERDSKAKAVIKQPLRELLKEKGISQAELSRRSDVSLATIRTTADGGTVFKETADKIAAALGYTTKKLFVITVDDTPLSTKTVCEYHRLLSTIFAQADKEMIIPFNPARKATPPKTEKPEANYLEVEDVLKIRESLQNEPLKWQAIIHLLLITGARRGEIAGLKWDVVDWHNNQIYICRNLLYSSDVGIYETSTKTDSSERYIKLPAETMALLKSYRSWYLEQKLLYGDKWHDTNYLFVKETAEAAGLPMHPDSITQYCNNFSKRYGLPHINPHAFRHTMASVLYFNGADSVSISKRLGHSKVSTTTDIYSHIMRKADEKSAECIADALLRTDAKKRA